MFLDPDPSNGRARARRAPDGISVIVTCEGCGMQHSVIGRAYFCRLRQQAFLTPAVAD